MSTKKQTPKRRRARKKNHYFTQDHEDAIIKYCLTNCSRERTQLYVNWIEPAFNEMVDKIVYTYKFNSLPNIDSLKDECKIWLITILDKYDKIFLYLRFLYSGFSRFNFTNFKLKFNFGLILFLKDIEIIFLFIAILNR